jgi:hypothetical protein
MIIRKISIGPDYKSGAMHYITGQKVLGDSHVIHLIKYEENFGSFQIWIEADDEVVLWKEFTSNVPVSVEYNIDFK